MHLVRVGVNFALVVGHMSLGDLRPRGRWDGSSLRLTGNRSLDWLGGVLNWQLSLLFLSAAVLRSWQTAFLSEVGMTVQESSKMLRVIHCVRSMTTVLHCILLDVWRMN